MALEMGFVSLQEEGLCHMAVEYCLKPGRRASLDMKNKELLDTDQVCTLPSQF